MSQAPQDDESDDDKPKSEDGDAENGDFLEDFPDDTPVSAAAAAQAIC